ncbi:alpha/beta-hydrolase, partial [Ramicandelaber brevisporus]
RVVSTFSHLIPSATGYLARDDTKKHLILAFRGTTTPLDMLNNVILLDAEYPGPSAAPGSKVHLGWLESYRSVTDQFMPNLVRLMEGECKGYKLVITGQSMGAAHAILAAVDIHLKHPNWSLEAHPSAQPRVGNEQWAKFVSALPFPIYRLTAYDDPVPHLPPSAMGFKHHRGEVYISS